MKALVVDDSRVMRSIIKRLIVPMGFEVSEAGNGVEALEKLRGGPLPDLMLVDWNMPEMNGIDLVRAVRTDAGFAGMRIMMVTTEAEIGRVAEALSAGADEYLMKPFDGDCFTQKLAMVGLGACDAA